PGAVGRRGGRLFPRRRRGAVCAGSDQRVGAVGRGSHPFDPGAGGRVVAVAAILIGLMLSAPAAETPAPSDADLLSQAEAAFREGAHLRDQPDEARRCFRQAAAAYETLRQQGAANTALFRNQGNACLLAGDLPGAILAF